MQVLIDQWTPLFQELAGKVNSDGRKSLLNAFGSELYQSALSNFGGELAPGDMRPWYHEELVSEDYKRHVKREFATLYRTEEERADCEGSRWQGGTGLHLVESFRVTFGDNFVALSNIADYASQHQNGEGVPRRPFFPVDEAGNLMPFMESRLFGILDGHFQK